VVLDEVGRGTSTYDGMAIARAVAEHLHSHPGLGCKTLFATHYHEMTEMIGSLPNARNYNVAVAEEGGQVVFLHRIVPGGASKSYGIHVAGLAGLPRPVVNRAGELLEELEGSGAGGQESGIRAKSTEKAGGQLPLFQRAQDRLFKELEGLDLSTMTPLEALNKLFDLQQKAREG
jgi:DNA mismatch repair protein MutS